MDDGPPGPNTRKLLVEAGGFLYDRNSLADELPYWLDVGGKAHLVIPYSYETNDNRFGGNGGFSTSEQFFTYMRDAFDTLYHEGKKGSAKLLSIGLHDHSSAGPADSRAWPSFWITCAPLTMSGFAQALRLPIIGAANFRRRDKTDG